MQTFRDIGAVNRAKKTMDKQELQIVRAQAAIEMNEVAEEYSKKIGLVLPQQKKRITKDVFCKKKWGVSEQVVQDAVISERRERKLKMLNELPGNNMGDYLAIADPLHVVTHLDDIEKFNRKKQYRCQKYAKETK